MNCKEMIEITDYSEKQWKTKKGFVISSFFILGIVYELYSKIEGEHVLGISFQNFLYFCILIIAFYFIYWTVATGRVLVPWHRIVVAIHSNVLTSNNNLEKVLKAIIKEGHLGHWFDIIVLPSDLVISDAHTAEGYC